MPFMVLIGLGAHHLRGANGIHTDGVYGTRGVEGGNGVYGAHGARGV